MELIKLAAFAKINWTLRILGKRTDGYHELQTIFQTISLHDNLTFALSEENSVRLTCNATDIPVDDDNLILRAADALRKRFGIDKGALIHLDKRIPIGGGLGGGSSDAAVTLLALARLWKIDLGKEDLEEIGRLLGADVPFFFTGGTALGTGVGNEILPLADMPARCLLIVTPNVRVSTAGGYKALNSPALTKVGGDTILFSSRLRSEFSDLSYGSLANDFEPVIFRLHPEIKRARDHLISEGAHGALLSGSGASVFGIFESVEAQERAETALSSEPGWRVVKCATVTRAGYLKELGECAAPLPGAHPTGEGFDIGA